MDGLGVRKGKIARALGSCLQAISGPGNDFYAVTERAQFRVGSSGSGFDEMKQRITFRPKGEDRLLMAMSQFRQKGKEGGKDVQSLEKLGLYYVALNPLLGNARQLREFVVRAVQRMPPREDRIKCDHLFSAGDPENKAFWLEAVSIAGDLENRFVAVED